MIQKSWVGLLTGLLLLSACGKENSARRRPNRPWKKPKLPCRRRKAGANGEVTMSSEAPELKQMTIETVKVIAVPAEVVAATARIEANPHNVGHALAPVAGRITNVSVHLGDTVTRGQVVATMESTAAAESESEYLEAQTAVHQAELAAAKADADLARLNDLYEHQAVAQKEVLAARTTQGITGNALEQSKEVRDQVRRRLELLGLKAGQTQQRIVVTAPISGKVMEVSAVEGEYRNEINVPLVTIVDLTHVWVTSEVPESKIRLCRVGGVAELELIAYPNEKLRAHVTRIADSVNNDTRTIKVIAEIENKDGRLRPDMFGNVQYAGGEMMAPWIPKAL
ncbi:MAG: efflux RND transporter periplasmic adaptor subunit [Acidobacteriota bacterium]